MNGPHGAQRFAGTQIRWLGCVSSGWAVRLLDPSLDIPSP